MSASGIMQFFKKVLSAIFASTSSDVPMIQKNNAQGHMVANLNPINGNDNINGNIVGGNLTIGFAPSVDEKRQEKEQQEKKSAISLFKAAINDLECNGSHVGNSKVKFTLGAIDRLLAYSGPFELTEENKAEFKEYRMDAYYCNGYDGGRNGKRPTGVQARRGRLIAILKQHIANL